MVNKLNVVIGGEIITLKSTEQPDYLQRLARYVDQKLAELKSKSVSAAIDDRARTLLIALNIADDYHKALEKFQRLDAVYKRFQTDMGKMRDDNATLTSTVQAMQEELDRTHSRLEEVLARHESERQEAMRLESERAEALKEEKEKDKVITLPPHLSRKAGRR